ncbi:type II toxin-antitoxin system PemK/MazF family toxin [Limosilactobacillus sp. STM2_1]|uniref:Type II toxin-antitoxin system PemK/MazF family toxin n=1 Tax=Limosilactobacillus rudii TaxID=2759755 RepID=A0A7W3YMV5_9LACO|nr:type II toxin-antitoxin system PemK/MazF family toxin [Limosilactobacillus rudii]MBB1080195.1 type II toxin-antitoxin system PemK/MazF family toxin [Limosilactobacillus rudii]MBB1096901.1 type II toxin-antitoxin system PemK/MazF family toxin [Limosilactobacillus rudii]MCD7133799.1 type II toxin-antitoxin system PemK/MazF family toxin [Limosilactobacillus rudii]
MSEYMPHYTEEQKRQKISKFNNVYYNGDPADWKVSRLPNWMSFYGYSLDKELKNDLPHYYRRFRQGTVVMIDYGVTIGNELGGKHFGVVLNNDDTKYKRKVTVVPLSSHWHKGYIDLGYDLMSGINDLVKKRSEEEQTKIQKLSNRLEEFRNSHKNSSFPFTEGEEAFLEKNVKDFPKDQNTFSINFLDNEANKELISLITNIKKADSWEQHRNIFDFVSFIETAITFKNNVDEELKKLDESTRQLHQLAKKLNKYNKQSFAVISDIKSVSKLRVAKLNHFTISGNTQISAENLGKIRQGLIKTIE